MGSPGPVTAPAARVDAAAKALAAVAADQAASQCQTVRSYRQSKTVRQRTATMARALPFGG